MERIRITPKPPVSKPKGNPTRGEQGFGTGAHRPKGVPNKVSTSVKEAIMTACALHGSDGVGKDGLIGYLSEVVKDFKIGAGLLRAVLPLQVKMQANQPVQILNIPAEMLTGLPSYALDILEAVINRKPVPPLPNGVGQLDAGGKVIDAQPNEFQRMLATSRTEH